MNVDKHLSKRLSFLLCCIALLITTDESWANNNQRKQAQIKAAFIFQMAKFINWKYEYDKPIEFCFHQDNRSNHVYGQLKQLQTKGKLYIEGREVQLKILPDSFKDIETYQDCKLIYFIPRVENNIPTATLKRLNQTKLLIGNSKTFLAKGGMSALIIEEGKNRLYINRSQYQQSKVKIRSRLMKLARMYPK